MATNIYTPRKPDEQLTNIYMAMRRGITYSKRQASIIVGGRYVLERLVAEKKIRMTQPHQKQNSRWECNGEDVLRYAQDYF